MEDEDYQKIDRCVLDTQITVDFYITLTSISQKSEYLLDGERENTAIQSDYEANLTLIPEYHGTQATCHSALFGTYQIFKNFSIYSTSLTSDPPEIARRIISTCGAKIICPAAEKIQFHIKDFTPTDTRYIMIGRDYVDMALLVYDYVSHIKSTGQSVVFPTAPVGTLDESQIAYVCTIYLGCALLFLGQGEYNQFFQRSKALIVANRFRVFNYDTQQRGLRRIWRTIKDDLPIYAFLGLTSLSKAGAKPAHVNEWLAKRLSALLTQVGCPKPPVWPPYEHDLLSCPHCRKLLRRFS